MKWSLYWRHVGVWNPWARAGLRWAGVTGIFHEFLFVNPLTNKNNIFLAGVSGRKAFQAAITEFERKTCIRFIRHTHEEDYIWVHRGSGWVSKICEPRLILENPWQNYLNLNSASALDTTKQWWVYHIWIEANFHPKGNEYHFVSGFV